METVNPRQLGRSTVRTEGSQKGFSSPSVPARAKKNLLSFMGTCLSLLLGSNPCAFCLSFITIIVLLAGLGGTAFEVDGFEDVAAVFGKFLCSNANAASFFFCFSTSAGVSGAISGFAERSVGDEHIMYISHCITKTIIA